MKKLIILLVSLISGTFILYGQPRKDYKNGGTNMYNKQSFIDKNCNSIHSSSSVHEVKHSCFRKDSVIRNYGADYKLTNMCDLTLYIYIESLKSSYILKNQQTSPTIKCPNPPIVLKVTHDNKAFKQWTTNGYSQHNKKRRSNGLPKDLGMEIIFEKTTKSYFFKFTNNGGNSYNISYEYYSKDSKGFITNSDNIGPYLKKTMPCGEFKNKFRNLKIRLINPNRPFEVFLDK